MDEPTKTKLSSLDKRQTKDANAPNKTGDWMLICLENDYTPELVRVTKSTKDGNLYGDLKDVGVRLITDIHTQLMYAQWRLV